MLEKSTAKVYEYPPTEKEAHRALLKQAEISFRFHTDPKMTVEEYTAKIETALAPIKRSRRTEKYSLEECVQIALQNNPGIISSSYSVDESAARVDEARSGYFPSVNINSSFDRVSNEGVITSPYNNYNAGVSARYYLFQGLKTNASVNAANYNYQASNYQHEVNKHDLILKITQGYYRMLQAERFIESANKTIERAKLFLDYANAKFKSGLASRSDILKAEVIISKSANLL